MYRDKCIELEIEIEIELEIELDVESKYSVYYFNIIERHRESELV